MPKPLSRIQLLWHRFWPPPAPAYAIAPISSAKPSSSAGKAGAVTASPSPSQVLPRIAKISASTTGSPIAATLTKIQSLEHHVHHRGEREHDADHDQDADRDPARVAAAEQVGEHRRRAGRPAGPQVREKCVMTAKKMPQCFQYRLNPVSAVSPVASVYRSISMFRNHWMPTPTKAPQRNTRPTCEEM